MRKRRQQGKRGSKQELTQPGGKIMHWLGSPAEPNRSNPRSRGKACWHLGEGKQEEKRGSRSRIRDQRMGPGGIWSQSNRTEPTGFEPAFSCVTGKHVRPLHHGSLYVLGAFTLAVLSTSYVARMISDKRSPVKPLKGPISWLVKSCGCDQYPHTHNFSQAMKARNTTH